MPVYVLHLDGDSSAVIRVLRAVLKAILRKHNVRCTRIEQLPGDDG